MGIVLGLVAAVLYGTGDYAGGEASDRVDVRRVLLLSQGTSALAAVVLAFAVSGSANSADLARGSGAGLFTALGLGLLYRALAVGRASVVAPITAVVGALVPVTWGLAKGEWPGALAMTGVVCSIAAGALLARGHEAADGRPAGVGLALGAGLALGSSFVCYAATSDGSGLWPVLAARVAAVGAVGLALAVRRGSATPLSAGARQLGLLAGACDIAATVALVGGLRAELAVLVAALASLAPGFTVLCAFIFRRERLGRDQLVGVGVALVGLALIAAR